MLNNSNVWEKMETLRELMNDTHILEEVLYNYLPTPEVEDFIEYVTRMHDIEL